MAVSSPAPGPLGFNFTCRIPDRLLDECTFSGLGSKGVLLAPLKPLNQLMPEITSAVLIGNGDYTVVERRLDVCYPIGYVTFLFL